MGDLIKMLDGEDMFVNSIEFGADSLIVYYQERHDLNESTNLAKTMVVLIDSEEREIYYEELQRVAREIVDDGYINLRNPPQEL